MDYLQQFFNVLILLFWVRLWSAPLNEFYFNPFLSGTVRLTDSVFAFLRPVLNVPEQAAACLVLLLTATFKTLLVGRLGGTWTLTLGNLYLFASPAAGDNWAPHFLFSVLHAGAFLIRLWTVFFMVSLITSQQRSSRASEAFSFFCRPFSHLPFYAQPVVLVALHFLLAAALSRAGVVTAFSPIEADAKTAAANPFLAGPLFAQLLKTGWLAALSFADGLVFLMRALVVFVIGGFGASLMQAQGAVIICHEAVDLLLGRFARNRVATGMGFDFTPLVFFFIVSMLYDGIRVGLHSLIQSPFLN